MNVTNKLARRILTPNEMHAKVMALAAAQNVASEGPKVIKIEVTMKPTAKAEGKTAAKVTAQRTGKEVTILKPNKEPGPLPINVLLPGVYTALEYQILVRDAGKRQVKEPGTGKLIFYPNGSPKIMVDPMAKIQDEQTAISGFCGYFLPHMAGSKKAGPHGVQLHNANAQALRLVSTQRGDARMSNGAFPLNRDAGDAKAWNRGASVTLGGYVHGMPDATRKIVDDLLKREELCAKEIARHEFASRAALATLEAVPSPDAKEEARLDEVYAYHQSMIALERERVVEIRRQLKGYNLDIPATMLEKEIEAEGSEELRAPSDNAPKTECAGCDDESCPICFEEVEDETEIIETYDPRLAEKLVPTEERKSLVENTEKKSFEQATSEPDIAAQIAALKAEIAARKAGLEPEAPKVAPPVPSSLDTDADLLAAINGL